MPIYGYACTNCGHTLDELQKISDPPLVECPGCDEPALKRQLSAPRFRLKGKGWYETDFKRDNQRNLAGEKEAGKKDEKKGDGKSGADSPGADKGTSKSDAGDGAKKAAKPAKSDADSA